MLGIGSIFHFSLFPFPEKINSSLKCLIKMTKFFESFHSARFTKLIHFSKSSGLLNAKEKDETA